MALKTFRYTASMADGRQTSGAIESSDERDAVRLLSRQGLFPIEISEGATGTAGPISSSAPARSGGGLFQSKALKESDITEFTRQMSTFLNAGFPLAGALQFIQRNATKPAQRELAGEISKAVQEGGTLSKALEQQPKYFGRLYLSMVSAGEESGKMALMFDRLAEMRERSAELRSEIIGALTYPALMMLAMVGSLTLLMGFVVPKFAQMFSDMGGELPVPTQILMNISEFFQRFWWVIAGAIVFGWLGLRHLKQSPAGRVSIENVLHRIPVLGSLLIKSAMVRFSRTLATLLNSGVDLMRTLDCIRDVSGSEIVAQALNKATVMVREGKPLSEALASTGAFPPDLVEMARVGEESGQLAEMTSRAADVYERQVGVVVKSFTKILEPIMILVMGVVIGLIVVAMLMPIFQMNMMQG